MIKDADSTQREHIYKYNKHMKYNSLIDHTDDKAKDNFKRKPYDIKATKRS